MAQYPCPQCGGKMYIEAVHEGYEVPCPHCGDKFRVPRGAASASASASAISAQAAPPPPDVPDTAGAAGAAQAGSELELEAAPSTSAVSTSSRLPPIRREPRVPATPLRSNVPEQDPQATLILILGILGIVICGFLAPVAWYMGQAARTRARAAGRDPDGMVTAGWILGIVGSVLMLLSFALIAVYFVFIFAMVGSQGM